MMEPEQKKVKVTEGSSLEQLKAAGTVVVADTGDFQSIAEFTPQDATTNPSLILAAARQEGYSKLIDNAVEYVKAHNAEENIEKKVELAVDRLLVEFGKAILEIVPGRVSTEVDARLSFDKEGTVKKALEIIELYEKQGISKERVLIKIASTWEGIQAAKELEQKHGVHVNLTLLFSFAQAVAAAEAQVTLISPFVGRIMDWYKAKTGETYQDPETDPGVLSVRRIYNYYKKHGYNTIVMGASFRSVGEIRALAGCDYLTISPALLKELKDSTEVVPKLLDPEAAKNSQEERTSYIENESKFRFDLNEDAMATEKLAEGIRKFSVDIVSLFELIKSKIEN